ncbi:unnamed protein product [Mucor hiemalis]
MSQQNQTWMTLVVLIIYSNSNKNNNALDIEEENPYPLPGAIIPYVDKVMNSENLKEYERNIKNIPDFEEKDEVAMEFVQGIFNASHNLYKTKQNIKEFESIFNDLYVHPYLKITANALFETREKSQSELTVGEIP